jgi:hypothetical protein
MYRSACFSNSPTSNTTDVVPSPVMSSWAVAARAIMTCLVQYSAMRLRAGNIQPWGFGFAGQLLAVLGLSTAGTYHLLQQNASVFCEFDLATLSVHARRAGNMDVRLQHHRPAYTRSVARLGEFSDSVLTSSVCRGVPGWKQGPGKAISTCCGAIETAAYLLQALSGRNVDAQSFPAPLCGC